MAIGPAQEADLPERGVDPRGHLRPVLGVAAEPGGEIDDRD
jgi:hypothetical protein